ncbi:MAG: CDP-alcohol phosphatidyltransferase family protein [Actinobacteria bacterium]|nr:CDP-alcohol phosphatidyltransferase family protein [Actinomycetota bacterium]
MSVFRSGSRNDGSEVVTDRLLTLPNVLSVIRLAALPLVYADIAGGREARGLIVLIVVASSDFVDGYLARRLGQVSRLGQIADPVSDRLLVVVVGIALIVGGIVPLWAMAVIFARDAFMLVGGSYLLWRGVDPPPVTDLGKAATFGLMGALTLFLVARVFDSTQLRGSAWVMLGGSSVLYYLAAGQYVRAGHATIRARRVSRRRESEPVPAGDER